MSYIDDLKAAIKEQEVRFEAARTTLANQRRYTPVPAYFESQNQLTILNQQLQEATHAEAISNLNIKPNTLNQVGAPTNPTNLSPLLIIGGLVAAIIILK